MQEGALKRWNDYDLKSQHRNMLVNRALTLDHPVVPNVILGTACWLLCSEEAVANRMRMLESYTNNVLGWSQTFLFAVMIYW